MRIPIVIAILTQVVVLFSTASASRDLCEDLRTKNRTAATGPKISQYNWRQHRDYRLFFLGEEHGRTNPEHLFGLANLLTGAGSDRCLFVEAPSNWTMKDVDSFYRQQKDPEFRRLKMHMDAIFSLAGRNGYKMFFVDHPRMADTKNPVSLNERDAHIAVQIQSLYNSGVCKRGAMIVGKAHITPDMPNRVLVRDILKKSGLSSFAVNLLYADDNIPYEVMASWNKLCLSESSSLRRSSVFSNSALKNIPLYPLYRESMQFSDFNISVLFQSASVNLKR